MSVTDRSAILERERRWTRPAGIVGILGAILIQVGGLVRGSAVDGDGIAEQMLNSNSGDEGTLLLGTCITALGFLLLVAPLAFLLLAASARSERVQRPLLGLGVLGVVLIAAGLLVNHSAFLDAADSFKESEARQVAPAAPAPEETSNEQAGGADKGGTGESSTTSGTKDADAQPKQTGQGDKQTIAPTTTDTPAADPESEGDKEDADDRARDALADASGSTASAAMVRGGALALAVCFFYTSLWCLRTGLLTRFWGSLGMASAVVLGVFGPSLLIFGLVWFIAMGMMLIGFWVGGRPPAWEAGVALPWPKGGEPPPDARDPQAGQDRGTVEGEGRDISGLPAAGEGDSPGEKSPPTEPPRKRKRRS